jgi:hypothetical protein
MAVPLLIVNVELNFVMSVINFIQMIGVEKYFIGKLIIKLKNKWKLSLFGTLKLIQVIFYLKVDIFILILKLILKIILAILTTPILCTFFMLFFLGLTFISLFL